MKIAVITAMEKEFSLVSKVVSHNGNDIFPAISGIGKVNATITAVDLIYKHHPDYIISTGVAGGLGENVKMGDIVVSKENAYHDVWCGEGYEEGQVQGLPARFPADPYLVKIASELRTGAPLHCGLICSGDQFLITHESDQKILSVFPDALACDMESAAIAHVCFLKKIPFLSFRIISDTHEGGLGEEHYKNFWAHVAEHSFNVVSQLIDAI